MGIPIIDSILGIGSTLISRLVPDVNKKQDQDHEARMSQIEVNKEEARTGNLFLGGWRPFLGWSMGFVVVYQIVAVPLLTAFGLDIPSVDISPALKILVGLIGFF